MPSDARRPARPAAPRGARVTAVACAAFALAMVGAAFASVPLYDLFCKVTGYDGTPRVSSQEAGSTIERRIAVRFDTNVAPGLDWSFAPEVAEISARVGDTQTVFFRVRNEGRAPSTGSATFNVQPGQAGAFFVKMKCFCFEEQTLRPGETMDFPVVFYIEPTIAEDATLAALTNMTLSYTYFPSRNGQPVAAAETGKSKL